MWNWFEPTTGDGSYVFAGALARVAVSQQRSKLGWRLELSAPLLVGLPDDAVAPAPQGQLGLGAAYWAANDSAENAVGLFLKQGFVRMGAAPGKPGASLRVGRFEFIDGTETASPNPSLAALKRDRIAHRLIGNFGFSHVQRSMDGAHFAFDAARLNVTAAAFRPTRGVFDVDGWPNLDINVLYASLNSRAASATTPLDWRVFAIVYDDQRKTVPQQVDVVTFGGHGVYTIATRAGTFDLLAWAALQKGDWGALDHRASAYTVEAGVQPSGLKALRPWLRAGYTRSSGDTDAGDGEHGTFFQLLPTPRIYARFPFYNLMNVQDAFVLLILRPSERVTLRADAHRLRLSESADLWYAGGGAFEKETFGYAARPSRGSTDLAGLVDLSMETKLMNTLTATAYFAYARGGAVVDRIYEGRTASFGYVELEWRR